MPPAQLMMQQGWAARACPATAPGARRELQHSSALTCRRSRAALHHFSTILTGSSQHGTFCDSTAVRQQLPHQKQGTAHRDAAPPASARAACSGTGFESWRRRMEPRDGLYNPRAAHQRLSTISCLLPGKKSQKHLCLVSLKA